ncbi:hypothetical protein G9A89_018893 [Geosiphon pyriformis]|nr:hypothetical protein G9A89_018893 [Geosiphon pyriformis]
MEFKVVFLGYFSNNNSINQLANTFTTIKQEENEAVITYLEYFHRNLHQIQTIQADYFTAPQILNQFIRGLCSSILQHIRPIHPADLQAAVTNARDFKAAELEANHTQAINLVMNESSELDSKLKQFKTCVCHYCGKQGHLKIDSSYQPNPTLYQLNYLPIMQQPIYQLSIYQPSALIIKSYLKLEISNSCPPTNSQFFQPAVRIMPVKFKNQIYSKPEFPELFKSSETNQKSLISNIPPATIIKNKSLIAIFLFEIEELSATLLFSGTTFEEKPITAMYTDTKIDSHAIKLIFNSCRVDCAASGKIIMADEATKTSVDKIDNFLFEINGIITPIKVLVIESTQYQALVGNDWLVKTNTMLN